MNGEVVTIDPNTNCTACFRAYGDVQGRVPWMLPCYHTYCERCVWKHTRWNSVRCPECKMKHPAQHGPEAFPVNLQILEYIGRMIQSGYQMVEPPPGTQPVTPKSAAMTMENAFWTDDIDYDPPPKLAAQKIREAILDNPWITQTAFQKSPGKGNSPNKGNMQKAVANDGVIASSTPITPQKKGATKEIMGQLQTSGISPVTPVKVQTPNKVSPDKQPQIRILDDDGDEVARYQHREPEEARHQYREPEEARHQYREPEEARHQYRREPEEVRHQYCREPKMEHYHGVYQDLDEAVMSRYPSTHSNHDSGGAPDSVGSWNNQKNYNHGTTHERPQKHDLKNSHALRSHIPPNQVQNRAKTRDVVSNSRQIMNNVPSNQNGYDDGHDYQQRQHPDVLHEYGPMRRSLEKDFSRKTPGEIETQSNQPAIDLNADDWFKKRLNEDRATGTIPRASTVLSGPDDSVRDDFNLGHQNQESQLDLGHRNSVDHHLRRHNNPELPKSNTPLVSRAENKENIPRQPPVTKTNQAKSVPRRPDNSGQEPIPSTNTYPEKPNIAPSVPKVHPPTTETKATVPNNTKGINLLNQSGEVTVIRPPRFLDHEKREPPKVQWGQSKQDRNPKTTSLPMPAERHAHVPTKAPAAAQRQKPSTNPSEVRRAKSEEILRRPKKVQTQEPREMGDNPESTEDFFMDQLLKDATSGVERDGVVWSDRVGVIRKPKHKGKGKSSDMNEGNPSQGSKGEIPQRNKQGVPREIAWKGPASRFKCRVVRSLELKYNRVWHLCVMSDDSAVVCGERYGWCRLTHYSLRDGEKLGRLRMEEANGLTEIEHNGKMYLAIAYSKDRVIELYDVRDLRKTAHTYHVEPDRPGIMCTSSPYTLLYADSSKYVKPQDVTSLDCKTSRPVFKGTMHTRYPGNSDMCCVRDGDKSLLVTSYSHQGDEESGIYAYNRRTDTLEWSIKGYLRGMEKRMYPHGVTTDGHGHLFVCDQQNACVQMFSADGVYMGTVLQTRENGMFEPSLVRWSDRMSSLIIVHQNREETWMSVANVQPTG